ncbi:MAG: hypothetical protein EXS36_19740 [Pedosphaera sp.]|nr:hypothetical protein [Pedosphaera sp.]
MSDLTQLLNAIDEGDPTAADQLLPLVYGELRKLAAAKMAQEQPGPPHTMLPSTGPSEPSVISTLWICADTHCVTSPSASARRNTTCTS